MVYELVYHDEYCPRWYISTYKEEEEVVNEERTAYQTAFLDYLCDALDIGTVSREALDLLEAEFGRCYHAGYAAGMFYDTPEDNPKRHDNKCYSDDNLKG